MGWIAVQRHYTGNNKKTTVLFHNDNYINTGICMFTTLIKTFVSMKMDQPLVCIRHNDFIFSVQVSPLGQVSSNKN